MLFLNTARSGSGSQTRLFSSSHRAGGLPEYAIYRSGSGDGQHQRSFSSRFFRVVSRAGAHKYRATPRDQQD